MLKKTIKKIFSPQFEFKNTYSGGNHPQYILQERNHASFC